MVSVVIRRLVLWLRRCLFLVCRCLLCRVFMLMWLVWLICVLGRLEVVTSVEPSFVCSDANVFVPMAMAVVCSVDSYL